MSLLTHIARRVFLLLGLLTVFGLPARAADVPTAYVDASGAAQAPRLATQLAGSGPLIITILDNGGPNNGWYVADCALSGNPTTMGALTISGNVNLILADGCQLNVTNSIHVLAGNSLTIWAQTAGTGSLTATGNGSGTNSGGAGIGGGAGQDSGSITIHGGHITATGDIGGGAGIGGGNGGGAGGTITIDGGTVNATGSGGGAGIGGGSAGGASGTIAITGHATVSAKGTGADGGAGIGSGGGAAVAGVVNSITIGGGVNLLNVQGGTCVTMPVSVAAPIGSGCAGANPVVMFAVSASAGAHGTIAPAGNFAVSLAYNANIAIDFAIVPDAGYEIDTVTAGTLDVTASLVPVNGVQTYQLRSAGYGNDPIVATFRPASLPPTTTAAAVPTLGEWALALLALALLGMAGLHTKRRG